MRDKIDPLWAVVGEKVRLQGSEDTRCVTCPKCLVRVQLPGDVGVGSRFRCGLCGTLSEVERLESVADDGSSEIVARVAE